MNGPRIVGNPLVCVDHLKREIEALLASSKERERVLNNLIEQNNRLRAELDQSEAVVSGLRTENSQLQAQVTAGNGCPQQEPRALHPQREMKLKPPIPAAYNFVAPQHHSRYPKPDHISTTEVVERVTALNKEISDLAASLSHLLVRHRHLYAFKHCDWKERHDAAEAHLSKDIVSILSNQPSKGEAIVNPLISRIAIQVLIVKLLFRKIMAEEPQGNKSASGTVYRPARAPQNRPQTHTLPLEEWKNEVLEAFANACFVAEWTVSDQEHVRHQIFDSPVFNLGYELRHILSTTRKNATEYVELKTIRPKTLIFDPFLMDEAFIDPKIPARPGMETKVAGTTAMGLVKVTLPRGTDGLTHQLILKPKVVMKSGLLASQNYQAPVQPNIRPDRRRWHSRVMRRGKRPHFRAPIREIGILVIKHSLVTTENIPTLYMMASMISERLLEHRKCERIVHPFRGNATSLNRKPALSPYSIWHIGHIFDTPRWFHGTSAPMSAKPRFTARLAQKGRHRWIVTL